MAFSRPMKESFIDDEPPMKYTIKRRIRNICNMAIIMIEHYEANLLNQEILNQEQWDKSNNGRHQ